MSSLASFSFTSELWLYAGNVAWHFLTVPSDVSDEIADISQQGDRRGFGAVRVRVEIGATSWSTSVFPDKKSGCYVLPIKKQVRQSEGLTVGDDALVHLTVGVED